MRASTRSVITILLLVLALVCLGSSCKLGGPEALKSVTFNPNGGKGTMVSQTFTNGTTQKLATNTFTRDGYTFQGWNTAKNGEGTSYADNADFTYDSRDSGITLFAQWSENEETYYTVEFINILDPTDPHATQIIECGTDTRLKDVKDMGFDQQNDLAYWNAKEDGTGKNNYANCQIVKDLAGPGETIKLYSQWVCTIKYDANGGEVVQPIKDQRYITNAAVTLKDRSESYNPPEHYDFFVGWNTALLIGDGSLYEEGSTTTGLSSDITLYAMWMKNEERVTISKESVLDHHDQGSTAQSTADLGNDPRYIILATGPIYSDPKKTDPITTKYGEEEYCYITTDYEVKPLTTAGDTYYKDDGTHIRVIFTIKIGEWDDELPTKDQMSKWGNPTGTTDNKIDTELIEKLTANEIQGAAWSGTHEQPFLQGLAVILSCNPYWQHVDKKGILTRFQTAKFN